MARYQTPDAGTLDSQAPAGDGNGNVERDEYYVQLLIDTGVDETQFVSHLLLHPMMPNPAVGETRIAFSLPERDRVDVSVYDVSGRLIARAFGGELTAGDHEIVWGGAGEGGRLLPSGIYFVRLVAGETSAESKLVLLR